MKQPLSDLNSISEIANPEYHRTKGRPPKRYKSSVETSTSKSTTSVKTCSYCLGQKYQKLDHLDDTIDPLSNSTFVSNSVISSEDIDLHEISAAIANILQPENLENMIQTAINCEVEKRVKLFFDNRTNFIISSSLSHLSFSSSHLSSAPQK
ncbi:hypothetical protein GLOIN_2v1790341 [Rhizophagus irregularis DAOM 181602=DAOM 197198]|uniref:Uncharacterized protein n=1 Tax=Rhizophagus irregularis (strain DAOM 181602 / DAOM 197198 / MUCL 43194) TaxID=747089 RepID=A0A2P4NZ99_RHIID|nr:hypothetical protein GLOIN_2v1790341 [Rhizophagus irregularis DAOM 181602=DAOM 197198]POG58472.1 hypothetical protein GLOIN_2v1790341 [Rhizophagus irregularis DAOM 181602=DAOM 197198]|eukprot:XP_025165338.1 hypothetical protein GLOIN_2v1790341 [Rhizophagus irregularis DAOM 181602=DAOM 197198]